MAIVSSALDVSGFDAALVDADKFLVDAAANVGSLAGIAQRGDDVPHFKGSARSDANITALTSVIDLTARGVTFPAGSFRRLFGRAYFKGDAANEAAMIEAVCLVSGGTTPVIAGTTTGQAKTVSLIPVGITAPDLSFVVVGNAVTMQLANGEAEIVNMLWEVKVGKLQIIPAGV